MYPQFFVVLYLIMISICLHQVKTQIKWFGRLTKGSKMDNWLEINKLTSSISKTHFMFFIIPIKDTSYAETNDKRAWNRDGWIYKLLGVYLVSRLSWRYHMDYIKGEILHGIGIIYKAWKFWISQHLCFYISLIELFCRSVGYYKSHTDPILRLQKRGLRIITESSIFSHTAVLFSELHILKLEQMQMFM